jgi:tetratricopeptide (TPR) repeat protein
VQGHALRSLGGALLERGDYEAARSALEQALAIARAAANRRIEANCLAGLGDLAYRQGRYGEAAVLLGEAEATLRELDDRPLLADLLCTRGLVDLLRADRAGRRPRWPKRSKWLAR